MRSRIKTIKKIIANEEKTLMKSLEDYQTQIVELESENRDIDNRLKERDKVITKNFLLLLSYFMNDD